MSVLQPSLSGDKMPTVAQRLTLLACAALVVVSLIAYDALAVGRALLQKDRVDFSLLGLIRPLVALAGAYLAVMALRPAPADERPLRDAETPGVLAFAVCMGGLLAPSAAIVIVIPWILNETVREGQLLSILTEIVFLAALVGLRRP